MARPGGTADVTVARKIARPRPDRMHWLFEALERGVSSEEVCELTKIDPWFIQQIAGNCWRSNKRLAAVTLETASGGTAARSEAYRARATKSWRNCGRRNRRRAGAAQTEWALAPVFKRVDTCAAEFESFTPYMYSTYEEEDEAEPADRPKIMILGSGPNRIGQGIEFDYCCCHASFALREDGFETHHGELQSGNGFDRLRYVGPAVF